jgi:predicted dithiol-disulfide oxidoreductase (DUF899 family)
LARTSTFDFNISFTEEQQRAGDISYNYSQGNVTSRMADINVNATAPAEESKQRR